MTTVAAIQMQIGREKDVNLETAGRLVGLAADRGARLACLPEYFLADCPEKGTAPEEIARVAEPVDGPSVTALRKVARQRSIHLCAGSFIEDAGAGVFRNTSVLIGPNGELIGQYSKTHPENADPKYEVGCGIVPGDVYPVFETEVGRIGIAIDMDIDTPEVPRILALNGADIILTPMNWSVRWYRTIDAYAAAHCMMNQLFMVVANRAGTRSSRYGVFNYHGGSRVVDPEGVTLAQGTDYFEGAAVAVLDHEVQRIWREVIVPRDYPYNRNPATYGALVETKT